MLDRFAAALQSSNLSVHAGPRYRRSIDESRQPDQPQLTLILDFTLEEFVAAATATGAGAEFMWDGSSALTAGWRLLLTHVDEATATSLEPQGNSIITMEREEMQIVDAADPTRRYW